MDDEIRVNKPVRIIPQKPPLKPVRKRSRRSIRMKPETTFSNYPRPLSLLMMFWKEINHLTGSVFIMREKRFLLT